MLNNDSIKNRTIFCHDNLEILRGIDSDCVDLIYLDPPFNKKKIFTAPLGSNAEGASFSDIFREEDVKDEWLLDIKEDNYFIHDLLSTVKTIEGRGSYNFCYLAYMAIRLIECQRILKETGSLYLHCDPTMSHYLKLLLDCIFGEANFRNEIIWHYQTYQGRVKDYFPRKHDSIYLYSKSKNPKFKLLKNDNPEKTIDFTRWNQFLNDKNEITGGNYPKSDSRFNGYYDRFVKENGRKPRASDVILKIEGTTVDTVWDIKAVDPKDLKEKTGYPTQKPLVLLERIIKASTDKDDIVLDPFCGCATTCVAAEKLGRAWVGVDVSIKAYELVKDRMKKEVEWEGSLFAEDLVDFKTDPPARTDMGAETRPQKYVYIISNKKFNEGIDKEWKVGIASDVKKRLNSYQTSDPDRGYVLEYSFLTPNFREIEKYIHTTYKSRHEWVREPDMQKIVKDIELWGKG